MPLNPYFSNYRAKNEQNLVESMYEEAIKINGIDCYYLPMANSESRDLLYGEDPLKKFTSAFKIELYVNNVNDYGGSNIFSKFGLEMKSTLSVIISRKSFNKVVAAVTALGRPMEGDLIFVPVTNGQGELFEITYTHQNSDMSMMGRKNPFVYELDLEKFKYSQELIDTGVEDIDIIQTLEATSQQFYFTNLSGVFKINETVFQSPDGTYANSVAIANLSELDVNLGLMNLNQINGVFSTNTSTYGVNSGASCLFMATNAIAEAQQHAASDNVVIETEANNFIDKSESNPFGQI